MGDQMKSKITFALGVFSGLLIAGVIHGSYAGGQTSAAPSGPLVRVDETKTALTYVNAYRIYTAQEEVVFDLGFNMPNPNAADPKSGELLFTVSNRVVMTYANAKRLQSSLAALIKRYEEKYGEIPAPREDAVPPRR